MLCSFHPSSCTLFFFCENDPSSLLPPPRSARPKRYFRKGAANLCGCVELINEEYHPNKDGDEGEIEIEDRFVPRTEALPIYTVPEFNEKVCGVRKREENKEDKPKRKCRGRTCSLLLPHSECRTYHHHDGKGTPSRSLYPKKLRRGWEVRWMCVGRRRMSPPPKTCVVTDRGRRSRYLFFSGMCIVSRAV